MSPPPPRPATRRLALAFAAFAALAIPACRREAEPPFDPADYETPAAEAVLRRLLEDTTEERKPAKVGVIVLGERMKDSTPAFRQKFPDTGLEWFSAASLTTVWVGPVPRVVERSTQLQPFQLQVSSVSRRDHGAVEVVAAWAYEERMMRRRFLVTEPAAGPPTVQPLEIIDQK
jgi:hypothetical protein